MASPVSGRLERREGVDVNGIQLEGVWSFTIIAFILREVQRSSSETILATQNPLSRPKIVKNC